VAGKQQQKFLEEHLISNTDSRDRSNDTASDNRMMLPLMIKVEVVGSTFFME
jgi:hypothetical protein